MTWEEVRHQVVIAGRVSDAETENDLGGAIVAISDGPPAFTSWLAIRAVQHGSHWDTLVERPDRVRTTPDGRFCFLDLPAGKYTLTAVLPTAGSRYGTAQAQATVSRSRQGQVKLASVTIALPPTALTGQVTGPSTKPVAMAEVRLQGSSLRTFSGADGAYLLTGVEIGSQTLLVSAQGYKQAANPVQLSTAGSAVTVNVALATATS